MKHFDSSEDFLDSSEIRSLLHQFEEAIRIGTPIFFPAIQWVNLIYYYQHLEVWDKAYQAVEQALTQYPWQAELYAQLATLEERQGHISAAVEAIEQALQLQPSESSFIFTKAQLCQRQGKTEEAFFWLEEALKHGADTSEVWYQKGNLFLSLAEDQQALEAHLQAIKLGNPDSIEELNYLLCDEEDSKAIAIIHQAIDHLPFEAGLWSMLAARYHVMENYEKAADMIDYALAIDESNFSYYYQKASILIDAQQYKRAIQILLDSFHVSPGDILVWLLIAECYEKTLQYAHARRYYRMVIDKQEPNVEALLGLAHCLVAEGHHLEAIHYFHQVLDSVPDHFDAWKGLADAEYEIGNTVSCFEAFREALRINPCDTSLWTNWATRIFKEGRTKNAMVLLEEAIRQNPEAAVLYYQMAAYCFYMNIENRAWEYLENALLLNAESASQIFDFYPELCQNKEIQTIIQSYLWL